MCEPDACSVSLPSLLRARAHGLGVLTSAVTGGGPSADAIPSKYKAFCLRHLVIFFFPIEKHSGLCVVGTERSRRRASHDAFDPRKLCGYAHSCFGGRVREGCLRRFMFSLSVLFHNVRGITAGEWSGEKGVY